ncbi:unnamed protein product [Caenorhabditis bovis]|uniref:Uncharacterized protein n=1 Tax=Caenorhabditis bovis TaxID=2654633 RepID=A0A8S1F465_9PELO|nr:unnamed protein product [Caenorhabditis bovis]
MTVNEACKKPIEEFNYKIKSKKRAKKMIEIEQNQLLPDDIFREIINFSLNSKHLITLKNLNRKFASMVVKQIELNSRGSPISIDIAELFRENNPFRQKFYDSMEKGDVTRLHDDLRLLANLLEVYTEAFGGSHFQLVNLNAKSLGWLARHDEGEMKRAPFLLQRRFVYILKKFNSHVIEFSPVFMKPSRYIRTFNHRFETITELNLGETKPLAVLKLREVVFPALVNLENLIWHVANINFISKLPNIKNMKKLILTCHPKGRPTAKNFEILSKFENLEEFWLGLTVPRNPSRMIMDIVLNLYQTIWETKLTNERVPSMRINGKIIRDHYTALPNLKIIGFWNSPEKIFVRMVERNISYKTVNFGIITQDLKHLCSFDSLAQSLFKFEEALDLAGTPKIQNLNLNLHAMPVVPLEYYLPNLMNRINNYENIKQLSIFLNCNFNARMDGSWILDGKKHTSNYKLNSTYSTFSLHVNGYCELNELELQLPMTLSSCSISLNLPEDESSSKCVSSAIKFITKLGDINAFPDLDEFHIQIWGVRCMEDIVDAIVENLANSIKKLSIIAMPKDENRKVCKHLVKTVRRSCEKLQCVTFSIPFIEIFLDSEKLTSQWKGHVLNMARKWKFDTEKCQLRVGCVPIGDYEVEPTYSVNYNNEYQDDDEEEHLNNTSMDNEECDSDGIVDDEEVDVDASLDELELMEQQLENETNRRHNRWSKKQRAIDADEPVELEESSDDVIDFDALDEEEDDEDDSNGKAGAFFDDEAVESDRDESEEEAFEEDDSDEQDFDEVGDSDDERLFDADLDRNNRQRKRKPEAVEKKPKRRRIIVSDEEDDE